MVLSGPGWGARLWWARVPRDVPGLLSRYGRPIRYAYTERDRLDEPLSAYRTAFVPSADGSGSAEMPITARPFTAGLVTALVSRGVRFAPLTLHTGVASPRCTSRPVRSGSRCRARRRPRSRPPARAGAG